MQISKHLKESSIILNYQPEIPIDDPKWNVRKTKEILFREIVDRLDTIGSIANKTKLFHEFEEREKKDSCCIGEGIALPHLRTLQCKDLLISIITIPEGLDFSAFDGQPVKIFVSFITPIYDDHLYKILYKNLSVLFENEESLQKILAIEKPGELIRFIRQEIGS